jgi:glycosyltransferase involved in cell wall biosynthesis
MTFMDDKQPLVSILINNYNYGRYLGYAIKSTLNQTYSNVEILVVDDGSTDNSRDIIKGYNDRIIAIFKENGGQASALNAGFAASQGAIICLLDADDLFLPEKVSEVVNIFNSFPGIDWFFHRSTPFKSEDLVSEKLELIFNKLSNENSDIVPTEIDFRKNIRNNAEEPNFVPATSNICLSRELSEKIFPLPEVKGTSGLAISDAYIKLLAVGLGKGCQVNKPLCIFRLHNNLYSGTETINKRKVATEIYIATAYWMRFKWLEFEKLSNKLLARGFGLFLKSPNRDVSCEKIIKDYLSNISFLEKIKIYLMAFYYLVKLSFVKMI